MITAALEDIALVLKDDLKKLGLQVRPRTAGTHQQKPGKISFDDRGNAIYEWHDDRLAEDGEAADKLRNKALQHDGLAIAEDEPTPNMPIQPNPKGLRVGYNPYESGMLAKKGANKKRDLHELSKWLEMKKKLNQQDQD